MGSQIFLRRKNVSEKVLIGNTHCSTPSTSLTLLPSHEEEGEEEEVLRGRSKKSDAFKNPHVSACVCWNWALILNFWESRWVYRFRINLHVVSTSKSWASCWFRSCINYLCVSACCSGAPWVWRFRMQMFCRFRIRFRIFSERRCLRRSWLEI